MCLYDVLINESHVHSIFFGKSRRGQWRQEPIITMEPEPTSNLRDYCQDPCVLAARFGAQMGVILSNAQMICFNTIGTGE
jgi:hypothetical protein